MENTAVTNDTKNETCEETTEERVKEFGSTRVKNAKGNICCVTIVGEVEGHTALPPGAKSTKYEHILPMLVSVEQDETVDALLLILNTMGGDVEAGLAISEMVASMEKPTASIVLGGSHSIGVPLAVSAKRSFIVETATMTVHPVRMSGMVIGAPQTYEYFKRIAERITNFVVKHSKISKENFTKLMMKTGEMANDVGSVVSGKDAVAQGLIDEQGGLSAALSYLYAEIKKQKTTKGDKPC